MPTPISTYFESLRHRFSDASSPIIANTQHAFETALWLRREGRPPNARSAFFEILGVPFLVHEMDEQSNRFHVFATAYNVPLGLLILSSKPSGIIVIGGYQIHLHLLADAIAKHFGAAQKAAPPQSAPVRKRRIMLFGFMESFGHHFWNEVSGLHAARETGLIDDIDGFIVGPYDYFNLGSTLETGGKSVWKMKSIGSMTTPEHLKSFPCGVVPEEARRLVIDNAAMQVPAGSYRPSAERAIWFQIRCHRRVWAHEEEKLAEIMRSCAVEWPNITFIIDGHGTSAGAIAVKQQDIDEELAVFQRLQEKLGNAFDLRSTIGADINLKVLMMQGADMLVGPIGSGTVLSSWITRIPTIVYGTDHYANMIRYQEETVPEGGSVCSIVNSRFITPVGDKESFDVDAAEIVRLIRQMMSQRAAKNLPVSRSA